MEHPLISNTDSLTLEELQSRISDLNKKLSWAIRTNNQHLAAQIQLAINSFSAKYNEKQQALYDAARKSGPDYSDKINIS